MDATVSHASLASSLSERRTHKHESKHTALLMMELTVDDKVLRLDGYGRVTLATSRVRLSAAC